MIPLKCLLGFSLSIPTLLSILQCVVAIPLGRGGRDDFFDYTGQIYNLPNFGNLSQDFTQSQTALGIRRATFTATASYKLSTENGIAGQNNGLIYFDAAYTFDAAKRIKTIKRYDRGTNDLAVDYCFYYP